MRALVTGASSGIGREMALLLSERGYEVIACGRDEKRLEALAEETGCLVIRAELSDVSECRRVYDEAGDIDFFFNNAGFGAAGSLWQTDSDAAMVDVNVRAAQVLLRLVLCDMTARKSGVIVNTASAAGFMPGPSMAVYYATKAYMVSISSAAWFEARPFGVYVGALCPGPVATDFFRRAGASVKVKPRSAKSVARYTLACAEKRRRLILPGADAKLAHIAGKLLPARLLMWGEAKLSAAHPPVR